MVATYSTSAPIILQEVPSWDLAANTNGVCTSGATHVIKNAQGTFNAANYASLAAACGMQVIWAFPDTVNYSTGRVHTDAGHQVGQQGQEPDQHLGLPVGQGAELEPHLGGRDPLPLPGLPEGRSAHKVMALFGDMPHFGTTRNPYTKGHGQRRDGRLVPGRDHQRVELQLPDRRLEVVPEGPRQGRQTTPGVPVYLMVQTHKYLRPATHKKQRPTQAQLSREVRDGFAYLKAGGIAFHVWRNTNYTRDQLRDPQMVAWISALAASIKAGTFH